MTYETLTAQHAALEKAEAALNGATTDLDAAKTSWSQARATAPAGPHTAEEIAQIQADLTATGDVGTGAVMRMSVAEKHDDLHPSTYAPELDQATADLTRAIALGAGVM